MQLKSPARHNSYSDSSGEDEEVEEAFSLERSRQNWEQSVYQTPASNPGLGRYDSTGQLDNTFQSAFYSPNLSMTRSDLNSRYLIPQIRNMSPATYIKLLCMFFFNVLVDHQSQMTWSHPLCLGYHLPVVPAQTPSPLRCRYL